MEICGKYGGALERQLGIEIGWCGCMLCPDILCEAAAPVVGIGCIPFLWCTYKL